MLQYDLSNTRLAEMTNGITVPTEGELTVLLVAMLLAEGCGFLELRNRKLVLAPEKLPTISRISEDQLAPLLADLPADRSVTVRLQELRGLVADMPRRLPRTQSVEVGLAVPGWARRIAFGQSSPGGPAGRDVPGRNLP